MRKNKLPKNAKRVFKGKIFEVWQWPQKMFDGKTEIFEKIKRPDTAQVIPIVGDKILILNQSQPNRRHLLSLAGGRRETGETPLKAARRELLEETGYASSDWKPWLTVNPVGKMVWTVYTYIARDCLYRQKPEPDNGEKITTKLIGYDEFLALADDPDFYEIELKGHLLRARCDKKEYKKFHKLLFNK